MQQITSRTNQKIKLVRALRQRKARQAEGLFLVEGIRHVGEAVKSSAVLDAIFFSPDLLTSDFALSMIEEQAAHGVDCFSIPPDLFISLAEKENPQGILAVVHRMDVSLGELDFQKSQWCTAVVSPQDPGNVGTILRTIDAVGADALILIDSNLDLYHPASVRASMGTIFHHPVAQCSFQDFSDWVKKGGYHIYGSSARAEADYLEARPYFSPRILLLGSEREGLNDKQRAICDLVVSLPMRGQATSLNLAVAAAILLYAMLE